MNDIISPALPYRGRFAPTPSGPLHLGSLLTALASWLDARHNQGQWLLRIDDLDRERCVPGVTDIILHQLEAHGLYWDETPRQQSAHIEQYVEALRRMQKHLYGCQCTRAKLAGSQHDGPDGKVYPGSCRELQLDTTGCALRFAIGDGNLAFDDAIQGRLERDRASEVGDFIVCRRDGVPGYQLACVVDEAAQCISTVVRGADLIGSTFCQLAAMDALQLQRPLYAHLPVLLDDSGRKLSKQNHATAIDAANASQNLWQCLVWLRQNPPTSLRESAPVELLGWAQTHWNRAAITAQRSLPVEPLQ